VLDTASVGVAQWLATPGDLEGNLEVARDAVSELGQLGCDLIVLPELWSCGYDPKTLVDDISATAQPLDGPLVASLAEAARDAGAWFAAGSVAELVDGHVFNTGLLFDPQGVLRAAFRKSHLYEATGEHLAFVAGDTLVTYPTDEFGELGLTVCFDGDFPETARSLRLAGAGVVVQVSAYEREAETWWDRLYPANALANAQWWIMSNQCGDNSSVSLLGGSQVIAPSGEVVGRASKVYEPRDRTRPELLVVELRLQEQLRQAERDQAALWQLRRPELAVRQATSDRPTHAETARQP
jgi:predicted amidohydrolase